MGARRRKSDETGNQVVYADLESTQETGMHVPNLVCWMDEGGSEMNTLEGADCVEVFLTKMIERTTHSLVTVFFHNVKGYDGQVLL